MATPDRRKVTMRTVAGPLTHQGVDYVAVDDLDTYIANARAAGWQDIEVGTVTDHGPSGPDGPYTPPAA